MTVRYRQYIIYQYAGMHQSETYSYADLMATEARRAGDWGIKKKVSLTRRSGTATISCDYKALKPISTLVEDPEDYKSAESIAIALAGEGKKGVRVTVEIIYELEQDEEDDEGEETVSEVDIPNTQSKKARKASNFMAV